ncbi:DUF3300 domain-containing protein [Tunturiibacter lichenicola]|uniref:DUF3300 domain-containing protein n=1 Tax=Tunturiibacter lichenicola TaxID=2051959 RepID=UPI003D9B3983
MNKLGSAILHTVLFSTLSASAFAQAPIVRQPPPPPPTDQQQQAPPAYPQAGQPTDPQAMPPDNFQAGQPQYQQQGQPQYQQAPPPDQQQGPPPPPPMAPQQLDQLVQRIALYPDPLLAQVLTASTFWDQIPDAATWAQQHATITGDALAQAIQVDNLPWDPSVLALLPFPSVLDMMARDPQFTGTLGNAVLSQRNDVMDAVQRQRRIANGYGYLAPNSYDTVADDGGYIAIQPVNPAYYYVPVYSPAVVFYAPRPGFYVGGALRFGPVVSIGPAFGAYGWYGAGFGWGNHAILIDHRPWGRTYYNRGVYVHPYAHAYVRPASPRVESHAHYEEHGGEHHH